MELVAFVGTDSENWGQITALINRAEADKIVLVKNSKAGDFPINEKCEVISVDTSMPILDLKRIILEKLRQKLGGSFEVALSLASGAGKEHMALLSALLSIPVGVRLVVFTKQGVEFIN